MFFALLTFCTILIAAVAWLLWARTRNPAFVIGIVCLYFWSIHGAWRICYDLSGNHGHASFHYLYDKLFPVNLGNEYFWAIVYYTLFILVTGVVALRVSRPQALDESDEPECLWVSHWAILVVVATAALGSIVLMRGALSEAASLDVAAYSVSRNQDYNIRFILHQLLNRAALLPGSIGFAIWASGRGARYFQGTNHPSIAVGYMVVLGAMYLFCFLMGSKNELVVSLLAAVLFYLYNAPRPRILRLATIGICLLCAIAYVDVLRGYGLASIRDKISWEDLTQSLLNVAQSNESIGAHLSMYGAIKYDVPLTYGSSLVSAAASVIPRFLWPDRPDDIYYHYAYHVSATEGQGYSIHHATGWYLNFGIAGLLLGAAIFGWVWSKLYNNLLRINLIQSVNWRVFSILAFFCFTAGIPNLIRGGPQGYKGIVIDCLIIPTFVFLLVVRRNVVVEHEEDWELYEEEDDWDEDESNEE